MWNDVKKMEQTQSNPLLLVGQGLKDIGDFVGPADQGLLINQVARGVGQGVPMIALYHATGPLLPALVAFGQGADQMAEDAKREGVYGSLEGDTGTIGGGVLTAATNAVVMPAYFAKFEMVNGTLKRLLARGLLGGGAEGLQETVEQFGQNAMANQLYAPDRDLWEGVSRSALVGFLTGFILGGGNSLVQTNLEQAASNAESQQEELPTIEDIHTAATVLDNNARAREADEAHKRLLELMDNASNSRLAERDAAELGRLVNLGEDNRTVFIPGKELIRLAMGKKGAAFVAELGLGRQDVIAAYHLGGDIAIGIGALVTSRQAQAIKADIAPHIRMSPQDMTQAEAAKWRAVSRDAYLRLRAQEAAEKAEALSGIESLIHDDLVASNIYSPAGVRLLARSMAERFLLDANQLGIDPASLYRQSRLGFLNEDKIAANPGIGGNVDTGVVDTASVIPVDNVGSGLSETGSSFANEAARRIYRSETNEQSLIHNPTPKEKQEILARPFPKVATLTGKEVISIDDIASLTKEDKARLRKIAAEYLENNVHGIVVYRKFLENIQIKEIKKIISDSSSIEKLQLFAAIPSILLHGDHLYSADSAQKGLDSGKHSQTRAFHYFGATIEIAGKLERVLATVKQEGNGNFFYNIFRLKNAAEGSPLDLELSDSPALRPGPSHPNRKESFQPDNTISGQEVKAEGSPLDPELSDSPALRPGPSHPNRKESSQPDNTISGQEVKAEGSPLDLEVSNSPALRPGPNRPNRKESFQPDNTISGQEVKAEGSSLSQNASGGRNARFRQERDANGALINRIDINPRMGISEILQGFAHLRLFNLIDYAFNPMGAQAGKASFRADLAVILNHLGARIDGAPIDLSQDVESDAIKQAIDENQLERFTESWLEYLTKDKLSSSSELKAVFRRFKEWLVDIYPAFRHQASVDVRLTMDLLATTQQEIAAQEKARAYSPSESVKNLLSPEEIALLQEQAVQATEHARRQMFKGLFAMATTCLVPVIDGADLR